VLHAEPWPLRQSELAALVWSDADRGHDVRSTLYRLRAKLRGSQWSIPSSHPDKECAWCANNPTWWRPDPTCSTARYRRPLPPTIGSKSVATARSCASAPN
jgi:hypothetical protein